MPSRRGRRGTRGWLRTAGHGPEEEEWHSPGRAWASLSAEEASYAGAQALLPLVNQERERRENLEAELLRLRELAGAQASLAAQRPWAPISPGPLLGHQGAVPPPPYPPPRRLL